MARCTRTTGLEIHHVNRNGGNGVDNAKVLCQKCHAAIHSYGEPGTSPPDFEQETKMKAFSRAWNQCECTSVSGCH
jgi:5-methylcytosine-specific restriction endonuclease McrA